MKVSDFDYTLPKELIAQYPMDEREKCRLMVLNRKTHEIQHKIFEDVVGYFNEGDCLVLNDTKVIRARLFGRRKTGGRVEIFLLDRPLAEKNPVCEALIRPSSRLKEGERIVLESGREVEILNSGDIGRFVKFEDSIDKILQESGHIPLPPYIDRIDEESDKVNYQTVYAKTEGATASPTAGLHFTKELLDRIRSFSRSGLSRPQDETRTRVSVKIAYVTLHTNYGTFAPIKVEEVENHKIQNEYFEFPKKAAEIISETKKRGGKVFAVGTTTTRVLEHCATAIRNTDDEPFDYAQGSSRAKSRDEIRTTKGYTDLFIYPEYKFKIVDHLITNFHLPKSTLLLLVSAFAGKDFIFDAYRQAIEKRYRFFSYGDAMLIL